MQLNAIFHLIEIFFFFIPKKRSELSPFLSVQTISLSTQAKLCSLENHTRGREPHKDYRLHLTYPIYSTFLTSSSLGVEVLTSFGHD